jgi:hypothetical protein
LGGTRGLSPGLQTLSDAIWAAFVLQFALEFTTAPQKGIYLKKRWLTAVSLALPALRLLRLVRISRVATIARATRGVRLARPHHHQPQHARTRRRLPTPRHRLPHTTHHRRRPDRRCGNVSVRTECARRRGVSGLRNGTVADGNALDDDGLGLLAEDC